MKLPRLLTAVFFAATLQVSSHPLLAANPDTFTLKAATGNGTFSLGDAKGKYVALHFLLKTEYPCCLRHTRDYFTKSATLPNVVQVFIKPDTGEEIAKWALKLPAEELSQNPIYRDPEGALANAFGVPTATNFTARWCTSLRRSSSDRMAGRFSATSERTTATASRLKNSPGKSPN
ncbi:MAG: redoxin domain-containing protein [Opitutus sp.]|nr:redoxin domain-containing protein [Opitutus sp.]